MAKKESVIRLDRGPRQVLAVAMDSKDVETVVNDGSLNSWGIGFNKSYLREAIQAYNYAMDGDDVGLTPAPLGNLGTPSITTPVQFLQNWLPGFVKMLTAARQIDELVGITTVGSWEDEEVVQGVLEPSGTAQPYGDYTNIPLASWNVNFNTRTVVRFEAGIMVGLLEEGRAARVRIATANEKRGEAAISLDIQRNRVGFYGYNDGSGATYGFLNDPGLPAYVTVATGVGGYLWSQKTFLEITADWRSWFAALQTASLNRINPRKDKIIAAIAHAVDQYLSVPNTIGSGTVWDWLKANYPNVTVVSAPELTGANGGANVVYLYPETVDDGSSDGSRVIIQVVPSKFQALGVEKRAKSYIEDYSNATAGIMVKRPWAVYRASGM